MQVTEAWYGRRSGGVATDGVSGSGSGGEEEVDDDEESEEVEEEEEEGEEEVKEVRYDKDDDGGDGTLFCRSGCCFCWSTALATRAPPEFIMLAKPKGAHSTKDDGEGGEEEVVLDADDDDDGEDDEEDACGGGGGGGEYKTAVPLSVGVFFGSRLAMAASSLSE